MIEEELNTLRQQDSALRDALRLDEAELPQMPADLNARVIQQAAQRPRKATIRRIWPWLVAACVAAFIAVNIAPPKDAVAPQDKGTVAEKVEPKTKKAESQPKVAEATQPQIAEVKTAKKTSAKPRKQQPKAVEPETMPAKTVTTVAEEPQKELAQTTTKVRMQTLTEHDIPITRPENYKYTPEELAQLRKQADEAYLKWVELELEISKNNLQQTAQQE